MTKPLSRTWNSPKEISNAVMAFNVSTILMYGKGSIVVLCGVLSTQTVAGFFVSPPPLLSSTMTAQFPKTLATNMTTSEKIALNVLGVGLTTAVVTSLANSNLNAFLVTPSTSLGALEEVGEAIVEATMPTSTADVVSVTLAESAAGVVAAVVSLIVSLSLGSRIGKKNVDAVGNAIGNGDFLVAQATAMPILESLGVPAFVATIASVVFAAIPAEVVKVTSTKKAIKKIQEEKLLQELLEEEKNRKADLSSALFRRFDTEKKDTTTTTIEIDVLNEQNTDDSLVVEIVSDIIKWLGYAVLCSDLGGRIMIDGRPPFPGIESAAFGATAALSAQVYSDILYAYFGFGGVEKQKQVRSRNIFQWLSSYTNEAVSGATLFGVYDIMQIPSRAAISAFLSGGVEGCVGSQDVNTCLQSYAAANPPAASPEAELRSLITALVSLWNQLPFDI